MSAHCCGHHHRDPGGDPLRRAGYRRVLWWVLAINALMFAIEVGAGLAAGSAALQADGLDFLGDAANYAISLFVVGTALRYRATAALAKGATMALFGLWVLGVTAWHVFNGALPHAVTMGGVGLTALVANAASFWLLWQHRSGDANMLSAWICTRNDVLGNLAVLLAAVGVFGTGTSWPDVAVAAVMGMLALQGAARVIRQAKSELQRAAHPLTVIGREAITSLTGYEPRLRRAGGLKTKRAKLRWEKLWLFRHIWAKNPSGEQGRPIAYPKWESACAWRRVV
jgi:Co/Zn/Cd efflux system component